MAQDKSGTLNALTITQAYIRRVQLAKLAIASGINILLKQATFTFEDKDALILAGGFCNYLNVESAMKIGLVPFQMKDRVIYLGNTAGAAWVTPNYETSRDNFPIQSKDLHPHDIC